MGIVSWVILGAIAGLFAKMVLGAVLVLIEWKALAHDRPPSVGADGKHELRWGR